LNNFFVLPGGALGATQSDPPVVKQAFPARAGNKTREEKQMAVRFIQGTIIIAILAFLILCVAIRPLREWLFGFPGIDDSKGFPWSRKKHQ
jgi:hypothetical protein